MDNVHNCGSCIALSSMVSVKKFHEKKFTALPHPIRGYNGRRDKTINLGA
jgi:hypothetical protein